MKLLKFKRESTEIMEEGGFQLHRWHSNVPGIEEHKPSGDGSGSSQENSTYAKLLVGTQSHETKILGVHVTRKNTSCLSTSQHVWKETRRVC